MKNNLTTFVFIGGRQSRIDDGSKFPKEFYYGYFDFLKKFKNIELFELNKPNRNKIIIFIDKLVFKIFKFPLGLANVFSIRTYKQYKKSSNLVLVNEHVFFSTLFLIGFLRLFKKINVTVFLMGMFQNIQSHNILQKLLVKFSFFIANDLVFLGEGEYEHAKKLFKKNKSKFSCIPFCVDQDFWESDDDYDYSNRDYILFVGNDLNRDFANLEKIVRLLTEYKFKLVSTRIDKNIEKLSNVEVIGGSWHNKKLSDIQLKELYSRAKIVLIPLKDTIQPSGQSVALQSMSCKTPVLITKTIGFWDNTNFADEENIFFLQSNTPDEAVLKIRKLINDKDRLNFVSNSAYETVRTHYKLENFSEKLEGIIFKAI